METNDVVSIYDMVVMIHQQAVKAGWWDQERSPLEVHMLIVSEVAEATEEVRSKKEFSAYQKYDQSKEIPLDDLRWKSDVKPEGELIELADVVIRIMDYCGRKEWDLEKAILAKHEYNKTRAFRHGGKAY